jgi:poly-gamma-glutamate capsule biosynthesis protein CapA/YwtB (metallophosphatase superfamily)
MTAAEATAPLLVETRHGTVAVLGFTDQWNYGAVAGPNQPGTALFSEAEIVRQRAAATTAGARWVVAYVHWGQNYVGVTEQQRRLAASFARAGYDLVVGHHAHVAQEVEIVGGMPVLYSLGNLVFGSSGRYTEQFPGYSVVARTYLGADGLRAIELACIVTDNDVVKHQPRPCTAAQTEALVGRLGPNVTLRGGKGLMELGPPARSAVMGGRGV